MTEQDQDSQENQVDDTQNDNDDSGIDWDKAFKHKRFKDLSARAKKAETELAKLQASIEKSKADELKEKESYKELADALQAKLDEQEKSAQQASLQLSKTNIALELGLINTSMDAATQADVIKRIHGEDEDTIRKDAESMLQYIKVDTSSPGNGIPKPDSGNGLNNKVDLKSMTAEEIRNLPSDQVMNLMMTGSA